MKHTDDQTRRPSDLTKGAPEASPQTGAPQPAPARRGLYALPMLIGFLLLVSLVQLDRQTNSSSGGGDVHKNNFASADHTQHDTNSGQDSPPDIRFMVRPLLSEQQVLRLGYVAEDREALKDAQILIVPPKQAAQLCNNGKQNLTASQPDTEREAAQESTAPSVSASVSAYTSTTTSTSALAPNGALQTRQLQSPLSFPLPLERAATAQQASGIRTVDLSFYPWASQKVAICLRATDSIDQPARTKPVYVTIKQRTFHHPLSKELLELRQDLLHRGDYARNIAMNGIDLLISEVEEKEGNNFAGALILHFLRTKLEKANEPDTIDEVAQLMWQTAVHFDKTPPKALAAKNPVIQPVQ